MKAIILQNHFKTSQCKCIFIDVYYKCIIKETLTIIYKFLYVVKCVE
jgi:hypothetical protein